MADQETEHVFDSGAKRSALKPRYDLIPKAALVRIAARFEMGLKYGEHNYKRGLPFDDTLNHIIDHLLNYKERRKKFFMQKDHESRIDNDPLEALQEWMKTTERDGDDLSAAAWGCIALMYLEEEGKLL